MNNELIKLINNLDNPAVSKASVITWGSPVLSFGNPHSSRIATLGLNPSNREFLDNNGNELEGEKRRFHTLRSLGLSEWSHANEAHLNLIEESFENYFNRNPYDGWFRRLDYLISGTAISYYSPSSSACHLDLIPYATSDKWTDIASEHKTYLLRLVGDTLGSQLNQSSIEILILNGQSVIENIEKITEITFQKIQMSDWTLPRKDKEGVAGFSYSGIIKNLGKVELKRKIYVLGYNHNIQSSFGVTHKVQNSIRKWITEKATEILNETK